MDALSGKTVLLVTHQVDFLPAFDSVLVSPISPTVLIILSMGYYEWHKEINDVGLLI